MENYIILKDNQMITNDLIEGKSIKLEEIFPDLKIARFIPLKRVHPKKEDFERTKKKIKEISKECRLCFRKCGINRIEQFGICELPIDKAYIFDWGPLISPIYHKTYAIYFAFCNLNCENCFYRKYWEGKDLKELKEFDPEYFAKEIKERYDKKEIFSLLLTGGNPDQSIYKIIELLEILPKEIPVIFETNGTMEKELYEEIDNYIDLFIISNNQAKEYGINLSIFKKNKYFKIDNNFTYCYNKLMKKKVFEDFLKNNGPKLMKYALYLEKNKEDAKDLFQDTITHILDGKIYEKIHINKNPLKYVCKIMLNLFLKKNKKNKQFTTEPLNEEINSSKASIEIVCEFLLEKKANEIVEELKRNHPRYELKYWKTYVKRFVYNIDYKTLEKSYKISSNNLRQMQKRIKDELEEKLKEFKNNYTEEEMKSIIKFIFKKILYGGIK